VPLLAPADPSAQVVAAVDRITHPEGRDVVMVSVQVVADVLEHVPEDASPVPAVVATDVTVPDPAAPQVNKCVAVENCRYPDVQLGTAV
jgi:hypothetical protein